VKYARPSDYAHGAVAAAGGPGLLWAMEKMHPSGVGKGGFAQAARLAGFIGAAGGFLYFYQRSIRTYLDSARIPPPSTESLDVDSDGPRHWNQRFGPGILANVT